MYSNSGRVPKERTFAIAVIVMDRERSLFDRYVNKLDVAPPAWSLESHKLSSKCLGIDLGCVACRHHAPGQLPIVTMDMATMFDTLSSDAKPNDTSGITIVCEKNGIAIDQSHASRRSIVDAYDVEWLSAHLRE